MPKTPKTCVVVSYCMGRPTHRLVRLLRQMRRFDSGSSFDLVLVCNGGDHSPLTISREFDPLRPVILNRENTGWNLGAWDHGWRNAPGYEYYLFLQDDCYLQRSGWVGEFEFRFENDPGIGLLGEEIMWESMSWSCIRKATDRDLGPRALRETDEVHPLETYQSLLKRRGVPLGEVGTHIPSIILFTSRKILDEVGGFPLIGSSYREAVACEIGISRLIAAKGYRIARIKGRSFSLIGHPEWTRGHEIRTRYWLWAIGMLDKLGIRKPRRMSLFHRPARPQRSAPTTLP